MIPSRRPWHLRCLIAPLVAASFILAGALSPAQSTEFIALGDMPYGRDQIATLEYIGTKIRDNDYPFVVHYGDVKGGDESCSDTLLTERRDVLYGLLPGRVFYTPGDNDWTDCDRAKAGGFDELERLTRLREIFYSGSGLPSFPDRPVTRQSPAYPENARWEYDSIRFVTLHIVGSDNGRVEIDHSGVDAALAAVDARDAANLAWLEAAFANSQDAAAIVAFMQADPDEIENWTQRRTACGLQTPTNCNPYLTFLERLTALADDFDKPVLLVHGSTNRFCLDSGFGGWRARKLWRLNGPGDFVAIDAAVVHVDPAAPVPFQVHGLLSGDTVPGCDRR